MWIARSTISNMLSLKAREKVNFVVMSLFGLSLLFILERWSREHTVLTPLLADRRLNIPNYNHLWNAHDMVFNGSDAYRGQLTVFGRDFLSHGQQWSRLCWMDSDKDGRTNGEELGDPCCLWTHSGQEHTFSLRRHQEYRRWFLSNPGVMDSIPDLEIGQEPLSCQAYDPTIYNVQFQAFYFHGMDREDEPVKLDCVQTCCFVVFLATILHWIYNKSLLQDVFPFFFLNEGASIVSSLATCVVSFFYLDMFSGVVHIVLDYAPHWIPVLGPVAFGTQLHHHDPTLFLKESVIDHVGHVHLILPIMLVLVAASNGSRFQRLWWFWCAIWAHLFQLTHRWSHSPIEQLPQLVRFLQRSNLLLTQDWHMKHHQDHTANFCFLSGQVGTDMILNSLTRLIPVIRYDLWLSLMFAVLLLPVFVDNYVCKLVNRCTGAHFLPSMVAANERTALMSQSRTDSLDSARLGLYITVTGLLYSTPRLYALASYCSEFQCLMPGCGKNQCLPSFEVAELPIPGHPASHLRHVLPQLASCIRAPSSAYLLFRAYQKVSDHCTIPLGSLHSPITAILCPMTLGIMAMCDIFAAGLAMLSPTGASEGLHALLSIGFFASLLGFVTLLSWSDATYRTCQAGGAHWSIIRIAVLCFVMNIFTESCYSIRWAGLEYISIFGQSALFLLFGLTLPQPGIASITEITDGKTMNHAAISKAV